jgi:hypothetical protein
VKVLLVFDVPEEREELKLHQDGPAAHAVLSRVARELRIVRKYEEHTEAEYQIAERIEALLNVEAAEEGLDV